jgi:hypothetical protein
MDLMGSAFDLQANAARDEALRPHRDRGPREDETLEQYIERCTGDTLTADERAALVAHVRHYQDRALLAYHDKQYLDWNQQTERAERLLPDGPDSELPTLQGVGVAGATANPIG